MACGGSSRLPAAIACGASWLRSAIAGECWTPLAAIAGEGSAEFVWDAASTAWTDGRGASGATYNLQPGARVCGRWAAPPVSHVVHTPSAIRRSRSRGPVRPRESRSGSAPTGGGGTAADGWVGPAAAAAGSTCPSAAVWGVEASCAPACAGTVGATGLPGGVAAAAFTRVTHLRACLRACGTGIPRRRAGDNE